MKAFITIYPTPRLFSSTVVLMLTVSALLLGGCASNPDPYGVYQSEDDQNYSYSIDDEGVMTEANQAHLTEEDQHRYLSIEDKEAALKFRALKERELLNAYQLGAQHVLEDFKGKLAGQKGFVYEPPVIECIEFPAGVYNGAVYPAHCQPTVLRPGGFVERNSIMLPSNNR